MSESESFVYRVCTVSAFYGVAPAPPAALELPA
jgi:hypothetical protein